MLLLPEVGICCTSATALKLIRSKAPTSEKLSVKFAPGVRWSSFQVAASTSAGTTALLLARERCATSWFIKKGSDCVESSVDQRAVCAKVPASIALKSICRLSADPPAVAVLTYPSELESTPGR